MNEKNTSPQFDSSASPQKTESDQTSTSTPSLKKSIGIATAIMMGSVFLSRIMGLVRDQVLAYYGGTSFEIDAYVTSFFIPELLNHFLAGGFLAITFIPIFQKHIVGKDMRRAWESMSNLLTIGSILFAIAIPLMIIFTPEIMGIMGGDPTQKALTIKLTRIILPAQMLFYWGAFLTAIQMANHKFFLPALAPLLYNLGIIIGGVVLRPWLGIEGFSWGVLIGAFLGNFAIQIPGAIKLGMRFKFRIDLRDPDLSRYVKTTLPLILGLGMTFSNEIFFRLFGSYLGEGGTASVNFALRTMLIVVAVFGQASGVAFFPFMSRLAAEMQYAKMTSLLNTVVSRIALYLVPLSGVMIVLSPQIISILYQHGKFSAHSTAATSPVLAIYLFGALAFSASMIVSRSFYAMQKTVLPMVISTITVVLSVPLYWVFSHWMGAKGIALASVIGWTAQFIVLYVVWNRAHSDRESTAKMVRIISKSIGITICASLICFGLRNFLADHMMSFSRIIRDVLISVMAGGSALALVFLAYEFTGLQRLRDSVKGLLRRG